MTRFLSTLLAVLFICSCPLFSQSVSLPTTHEAYDFLKRLEGRGVLKEYRDAAKPFSRREIAGYLLSIDKQLDQLTTVERDMYEFLRSEFSYEMGALAGDPDPTDLRWHLFSLGLTEGVFNLDLNLAYQLNRAKDIKYQVRSQGVRLYGYAFKNVGYLLNFADDREAGTGINFKKTHTQDPGIVSTGSRKDALEYNTTEAQLSFGVGSFQFYLEKMQNVWGYGERGNIILSRKSPSYPQIRMKVPLSSWMNFVYVLADLNSNVVDSARSYKANSSSLQNFYRVVYRDKYMAAHFVEFTITDGVDLALGESVIYSDKGIRLLYLIPVMFFKSGEHYNRDTDNVQWFGALDLNLLPGVNLNFSTVIDEFSTDDISNPLRARNQLGVTFGVHTYDIGIRNTELIAEYTRINPWVYSHKYPAARFTNNGFDLGHWIGQNADNLYLEGRLLPMRSLRVGVFYERYRKGGLKDVGYQYVTPSQPFLYGPVHKETSVGAYGKFQFVRDGFIEAHGAFRTISDEAFPALNKKSSPEFSLLVRYGIW